MVFLFYLLDFCFALQPGSRSVVVQHLDKVRANVPAKPAPAKTRGVTASQSDDQLAAKAGSKLAKSPNSKTTANISSGTKTITKSKVHLFLYF